MSYRSLEEVLEELEQGLLVRGMIPTALMDFVDESNVDSTMANFPLEYRTYVLEWARDLVDTPPDQVITIAGVSNLQDVRPGEFKHPRGQAVVHALRSYFERHPWP